MLGKCMISQPMNGLSNGQILNTRGKAITAIEQCGYEFLDSYFGDTYKKDMDGDPENVNIPVLYLSKAIERMSYCKAVYFCKGWEKARGCRIEHEVAVAYGLECIYE